MATSTQQLRVALETAFFEYRADQRQQTPAGDKMASAAEALLVHLRGQPSRRGKPFRVTYQHTRGTLAGRVFNDSNFTEAQAAQMMLTVIGVGGRVALSIRDDSGEYHEQSADQVRAMGYGGIADSGQYGDAHYSQEARDA